MATLNSKKTISEPKKYIISACLIGKNCFYDGTSRQESQIKELIESGAAIALCPEELGGLKTPRPPSEILCGTGQDVLKGKAFVFNNEGKDITISLIKGSREFLNMAKEYGVIKAILKSKSPCCGLGQIYDGSFTGKLRKGNGIAAELLLRNGIEVITDKEFLGKPIRQSNKTKNAKSKKVRKR